MPETVILYHKMWHVNICIVMQMNKTWNITFLSKLEARQWHKGVMSSSNPMSLTSNNRMPSYNQTGLEFISITVPCGYTWLQLTFIKIETGNPCLTKEMLDMKKEKLHFKQTTISNVCLNQTRSMLRAWSSSLTLHDKRQRIDPLKETAKVLRSAGLAKYFVLLHYNHSLTGWDDHCSERLKNAKR